ncbi:MAG TPA: endonuclease [Flavobacteriales bacterium]|nr:endonuclease [Flavobacteriales bacterium]HRJ38570.1 endonuclease [Flavobacteriales bacterium]
MRLLILLFSVLTLTKSYSQAFLPTSFSFNAASPPTGWILNLDVVAGATTYATGSDGNPSCRLDGTGEYVLIEFSDEPDSLVYSLRGTATSPPASAPGTQFTIQQSANGTTWSTVRLFDTSNMTTGFTSYTDILLSSTRYVRFYYTNKVSGSNVALDAITIKKADPGPEPAIAAFYNSVQIQNGGTIIISNSGNNPIQLFNQGTSQTLTLGTATLSGAAASDYGLLNFPSSISSLGNSSFDLTFTPSQSGTRLAVVSIPTNDLNDPVFTINIYGISGGLATEPFGQAQSFSGTNIKSFDYRYSFSQGTSNAENFLVLRKINAAVTETPVDGVHYRIGDVIGNAKVEYVGPAANNLKPDYAYANTSYHYAVFAFNGPSGFENYLTTNPTTSSLTTLGNMAGNYYSGVNALSSGFINALHLKINPHNWIYYSSYASTMIADFEEHDTINGKKTVMCQYSGYRFMYNPPFAWDSMSREHVFAHSWFPTNPASNNIEYSDLHNLFPAQLLNVNIPRSNNPMGIVVTPTQIFRQGKLGLDALGNTVYEPRDDIKGNVARAMFYMTVCYTGTGGFTWTLPAIQNQQILKDWHFQDLPDNYEIARNDYVHFVQGNRNPFVDSVHYACYIDFSTLTRINNPPQWCVTLSSETENKKFSLEIWPNPSDDFIYFNSNGIVISELMICDINGRVLYSERPSSIITEFISIPVSNFDSGVYFIRAKSENGWLNARFIRQ